MPRKKTAAPIEGCPAPVEVLHGYKAFNSDMTCRGFQYAFGQTYETKEHPVRCGKTGFHWCENPMDLWSYYDITDCRFAVVEASGEHARGEPDTKIASARLIIGVELRLPEIIQRAVDWMWEKCKTAAASGNDSRLAASGNGSSLAASGNDSRLAASGNDSRLKLGPNGAGVLAWWDGKRPRFTVLYVGEDDIEPHVWYRLDSTGKPVKC